MNGNVLQIVADVSDVKKVNSKKMQKRQKTFSITKFYYYYNVILFDQKASGLMRDSALKTPSFSIPPTNLVGVSISSKKSVGLGMLNQREA